MIEIPWMMKAIVSSEPMSREYVRTLFKKNTLKKVEINGIEYFEEKHLTFEQCQQIILKVYIDAAKREMH